MTANEVKQLMANAGVLGRELAEACNASPAYISQQLSGERDLQPATVIAAQTLALANLQRAGGFLAAADAAIDAANRATGEGDRERFLRGAALCHEQAQVTLRRNVEKVRAVTVPAAWLALEGATGEIIVDAEGRAVFALGGSVTLDPTADETHTMDLPDA